MARHFALQVDLTNAKAVAMVMADAKSEAAAEASKQSRGGAKTASDARAAAQGIMMKDAMASARNAAAAAAEATAKAAMAQQRASTAAAFWQKGKPIPQEADSAPGARYQASPQKGGAVTYQKVQEEFHMTPIDHAVAGIHGEPPPEDFADGSGAEQLALSCK